MLSIYMQWIFAHVSFSSFSHSVWTVVRSFVHLLTLSLVSLVRLPFGIRQSFDAKNACVTVRIQVELQRVRCVSAGYIFGWDCWFLSFSSSLYVCVWFLASAHIAAVGVSEVNERSATFLKIYILEIYAVVSCTIVLCGPSTLCCGRVAAVIVSYSVCHLIFCVPYDFDAL